MLSRMGLRAYANLGADTTTKPSAKDEIATPPPSRRWIYQPEDTANPSGPAANTLRVLSVITTTD
jgi:hypothetical protein